jgi:hypothetical protein
VRHMEEFVSKIGLRPGRENLTGTGSLAACFAKTTMPPCRSQSGTGGRRRTAPTEGDSTPIVSAVCRRGDGTAIGSESQRLPRSCFTSLLACSRLGLPQHGRGFEWDSGIRDSGPAHSSRESIEGPSPSLSTREHHAGCLPWPRQGLTLPQAGGASAFWVPRPQLISRNRPLASGGSAVPNPCPNVRERARGRKRPAYQVSGETDVAKPLPATYPDRSPFPR